MNIVKTRETKMGTRCKIELYDHEYCPPEMEETNYRPFGRTFVYRWMDSFPSEIYTDLLKLKIESEQEGYNGIIALAMQLFERGGYYPHHEEFDTRDQSYAMRNVFDYTYEVHIREKTPRDKKPEWTLTIKSGSELETILEETKFEDIRIRKIREL